jgi:hypothetical protein
MPIVQLKSCQVEGDLAQSISDMQQQVGEVTQGILAQMAAISTDLTNANNVSAVLDKLTQNSPPGATGLPVKVPTQLDDEERMEAIGIILIDGIMYAADGSGNIDVLRQLFFSVGSNTDMFLSLLQSTDPMIVVQTHLQIQKLPPGMTKLSDARAAFNNPAIENVYSAGDGNFYVLIPEFLGVNKSAKQVAQEFGIPQNEIITQVFWLNSVQATTNEISRMDQLGITGDFKTATISGRSLSDARPSVIQNTQSQVSVDTGTALSQASLLNQRFGLIDASSKNNFRSEIQMSTQVARADWLLLEQQVRFQAPTIVDPTIMTTFLQKNKKTDIAYLMTQRRTVSGINFQATTDDLAALIQKASNISAGNFTISSLLVNNPKPLVPAAIDNTNQSVVTNYCALQQVSGTSITYPQLQTAYGCLQQSIAAPPPAVTAPVVPQMGYQSFDSPSSILFRQLNFNASFNTDALTNAVDAIGEALGQPILAIVQAIIALLTTMRAALDQVLNQFKAKIASFVAQIEALVSRYTSFFGTASLDSSILKCSVGFNVAATFPILDDLVGLIDLLQRQLKNILAQVAQLIEAFLEKLLCFPLNLLNGFITHATSALPSFCTVNRVKLPQDLENALLKLKQGFDIQNTNTTAFSRDAVKLSATVQGLPSKLQQFRQSLLCESQPNSKFFSATQFTLNQGFFANPVAAAANVLKPIGG